MSTDEKAWLLGLVNSAGYLLQLRIEDEIRSGYSTHGWEVLRREHPWVQAATGEGGFIDLVAKNSGVRLAIECKRQRNGRLVFLVPLSEKQPQTRMRTVWALHTPGRPDLCAWSDVHFAPASQEASFCKEPGERTVFEGICRTAIASADSIARQELELAAQKPHDRLAVAIPVIATTARLQVCYVDTAMVSLETGEVPDAQFEDVPFIRFRKSFGAEVNPADAREELGTIAEMADDTERTVLVVNTQRLGEFLSQMKSIPRGPLSDADPPWTVARAREIARTSGTRR